MTKDDVIPAYEALMAAAKPIAESVDNRIPVGAGIGTLVLIAQSGGKLEAVTPEMTGPIEWIYDRVRRRIIPELTPEELDAYASQVQEVTEIVQAES